MISVHNLCFDRVDQAETHHILSDLSFNLSQGEQLALLGDSGSGKTTLLHLLAGLLQPQQGSILINADDITEFTAYELAMYRRTIGIIFQNYQLLPSLNIEDNILFQFRLNQQKNEEQALENITKELGIHHKLKAYPHQLSGGEQQRAAIARALIHNPIMVLADEPTGNLDQKRSLDVVHMIRELCRDRKVNFVMVTHSEHLAQKLQYVKELRHGQLYERN
jgi:ABC-type lipoprotein export system ATPase subunit